MSHRKSCRTTRHAASSQRAPTLVTRHSSFSNLHSRAARAPSFERKTKKKNNKKKKKKRPLALRRDARFLVPPLQALCSGCWAGRRTRSRPSLARARGVKLGGVSRTRNRSDPHRRLAETRTSPPSESIGPTLETVESVGDRPVRDPRGRAAPADRWLGRVLRGLSSRVSLLPTHSHSRRLWREGVSRSSLVRPRTSPSYVSRLSYASLLSSSRRASLSLFLSLSLSLSRRLSS